MKYLRSLIAIIIFSATSLIISAQNVPITGKPNWVQNYGAATAWQNSGNITGAYYYLLVDKQINIKQQSRYSQIAVKILNNKGIQQLSDISIVFDPSYQKLIFHEISVYRGEEKIDKLADHYIQTFQREVGHERYLYDGRLEAVVNLRDIRVDDVIVYSYSLVGFNPAGDGHISSSMRFQYSDPVLDIKNRIISSSQRPLFFKYSNEVLKPSIRKSTNGTEYLWEKHNTKAILFDKNVPQWYNPYGTISYTDFPSWKEVADLIVPLYKLENGFFDRFKPDVEKVLVSNDTIEFINQAIRFVQDKVRYLGFENGIKAFQPHSPLQVLNQRFGDCKDKSFLLCAILRLKNIEANPLLVNTVLKEHVFEELPGFGAFDHCVTQIVLKTDTFYVDPTISYQGGLLENRSFPTYGYGLIVKKGIKHLTQLPTAKERGTFVSQQMIVPNEEDSIVLKIKTIYYDSNADKNRSYFATTSLTEISKIYLDYYSVQYSGLRVNKALQFEDDREGDNKFIVMEEYLIPNISTHSDEKRGDFEFDFYSLDFEDYLYVPKSSHRTMPYATPNSTDFTYNIRLCFPGKPSGYEGTKLFSDEAFEYCYESEVFGDTISITHKYKTLKESIASDQVEAYLKDHGLMRNYLSYAASYSLKKRIPFRMNWKSGLAFLALIILGGVFSRKLYYSFDRLPRYSARRDKSIGGFLIVIAGGLIGKPLSIIYTFFTTGKYLNANIWERLDLAKESVNTQVLKGLLGGEMIFEAFQLAFFMMLIVVFIRKRTVFPQLAVLYMIINLVYTIGLAYMTMQFQTLKYNMDLSVEMVVLTVIVSAVFIFYLKSSNRVEQTFIYSLKKETNT